LYFVQSGVYGHHRDKKVVGVFVRFFVRLHCIALQLFQGCDALQLLRMALASQPAMFCSQAKVHECLQATLLCSNCA
jgi:hypothetical protein